MNPKRWFRLWLLVHNPRAPGGLPWIWWLQAGRINLVPPEAIGVRPSESCGSVTWKETVGLFTQTRMRWMLLILNIEQVVKGPWLTLHLTMLKEVSLRVM